MATKTERILSYLPGTFEVSGPRSPLKTLVGTFGSELLKAENSLAALMRAHWVDHADFGAGEIDDLARIGALYGVAPRADHDVEDFRRYLKQYVKTSLDGTVTVQGMLRIAALNLGLTIADEYEDMDTWWSRGDEGLTSTHHCGDDVAGLLFGEEAIQSAGEPETTARISGSVLLDAPVDLTEGGLFVNRTLRIKLNDLAKVTVDLAVAAADPTRAGPQEIIDAINAAFPEPIASLENGFLKLSAVTSGSAGSILVEEHANDAAPVVLGLTPAMAKGHAEAAALIVGEKDLSGSNDLSAARYLRLRMDNGQLAEIDCAGADETATTLDEIVTAINTALGATVASHDGTLLTLTSTTTGIGSSIVLLKAGAQDAVSTLFGAIATAAVGHDKLPASITGLPDIGRGVDLSENYLLRVKVNSNAAVTFDLRGVDPESTQLPEIVKTINDTLGSQVAAHNGRNLILNSTSKGVSSRLVVEALPEFDAAGLLLGIKPRTSTGTDASSAAITGTADGSAGFNLLARRWLRLELDQAPAADIDVTAYSADPGVVTLDEIVQAINFTLGKLVASHDGQFLSLLSPLQGIQSNLGISPFTRKVQRRFTTLSEVREEAAELIFGTSSTRVTGIGGSSAQVTGSVNLARGMDLRDTRHLELQVNDGPVTTIDCAGPRPRATLLSEIVARINTALGSVVASDDGGKLKLVAPDTGGNTSIRFHAPTAGDASQLLLGVEPGLRRGRDATSVTLSGVVDLSAGVDLSTNSMLRLSIDGVGPIDVDCAGVNPAQTSLSQLAIAINVAFAKNVAMHDGRYLLLVSSLSGSASRITIDAAPANDASALLLGFSVPRTYQGSDATAARIDGAVSPGATVDLGVDRFLNLAVDGAPALSVDCAAKAANPAQATLAEIVEAINTSLDLTVASESAGRLLLTSPSTGLGSRLNLQLHTGSDARSVLLGEVPELLEGSPGTAAVLEGQVNLSRGIDLSERSQLALKVDGKPRVDIHVRGGRQDQVFPEEIADAINAAIPGLATVIDGAFLQLTSPVSGEESSIELLPIRFLQLQEYLPAATPEEQGFDVRHGSVLELDNASTTHVEGEITIDAVNGVFGAGLVNLVTDWRLRLLTRAEAGERIRIGSHPDYGVQAEILSTKGEWRQVPAGSLDVGPQLLQVHLPSAETWRFARGHQPGQAIVLNNPLAPDLLQLTAQRSGSGIETLVEVSACDLAALALPDKFQLADGSFRLVGRLVRESGTYRLVNSSDAVVANLVAGRRLLSQDFIDRVVAVTGRLVSGPAIATGQLRVDRLATLFDVTLTGKESGQADITETYPGVSIGEAVVTELALQHQLLFGPAPSVLARGVTSRKADILKLGKGRTRWRYLECFNSRFNVTHFNTPSEHLGRFAGGFNVELGIADSSHVHYQPPASISPVYAKKGYQPLHTARVVFRFSPHRAGTLRVILPVDLPPRYGARFNQALFSLPADKPETFEGVVTEPETDDQYLVKVINDTGTGSNLLSAQHVSTVPLGFSAVTIPFNRPKPLANGTETEPAKIYLSEPDVGGFIELAAKAPGVWGNQVSIVVCPAAPAVFDLQVNFPGSVFENARKAVLGDALTGVMNDSLMPGRRGVLQAKAAGVKVEVTRENCDATVIGNSDEEQ